MLCLLFPDPTGGPVEIGGWQSQPGRCRLSPIAAGGEAAMAIKRPTKSRGAPSHKPAVSAPLRHVDVRAPQHMVSAELYVGWSCKKCGQVIAIAGETPGSKAVTAFDDQLTAIKCPHCGDEDLYHWSARSEQKYTPKEIAGKR
jgi:predicted RNA-binding Zn-ribbon protein involved in translation (DUF1610 family)